MQPTSKFSIKVFDRFPADYTFRRFGGRSNGLPSPETGSQQPVTNTSVSLESLYAN